MSGIRLSWFDHRQKSGDDMPTPLVELAKALSRSIRDEPISPANLKALEAFRMAAGNFVKGIGGFDKVIPAHVFLARCRFIATSGYRN
jgi:hypothetical protein